MWAFAHSVCHNTIDCSGLIIYHWIRAWQKTSRLSFKWLINTLFGNFTLVFRTAHWKYAFLTCKFVRTKKHKHYYKLCELHKYTNFCKSMQDMIHDKMLWCSHNRCTSHAVNPDHHYVGDWSWGPTWSIPALHRVLGPRFINLLLFRIPG